MNAKSHAVWIMVLGVLGCLLAGCSGRQEANSNAAIQSAIEQYLTSRPGIDAGRMILEVQQIRVEGERAQAEVVFRSRDNPEAQMAYHYELRREGGEWKIERGSPAAAGSPHPGAAPEGSPPPEGAGPPSGESLPQGHPPVEGSPPKP